jgi:hypothetical protein
MPLSRITSASIANSAVAAADIADGTITAAKIVSIANTQITGNIVSSQITSVANTQLTGLIQAAQIGSANATLITSGTLPIGQGGTGTILGSAIVPISVVQLSGLSSFNFSVAAYPQYIIYIQNLACSVDNTNLLLSASNDGGSTYIGSWNYSQQINPVSGSTTLTNGNSGNSSAAPIWTGLWNGTSSATNGYILIGGTSYYSYNKRITFSAFFGGQTPSSQCIQISFGQEQDDGKQFNNVKIYIASGTWYGNATALICGIKGI